jgi:hypothetical protein
MSNLPTNGKHTHNGADPTDGLQSISNRALEQQSDELTARLVQLLEHTPLSRWKMPLLGWLSLFAGLESELMRTEDTPAFQIYHCMATMLEETPEKIAIALSVLDFLTWRFTARNDLAVRWDFRREPLSQFVHRVNPCRVWQSNTEFPEPVATQVWLLDQYAQAANV